MVDDKERPGESEGDTPERTPETGSGEGAGPSPVDPETGRGEGAGPSTVDEAAGVEDAPVAAAPEELPVAEAGPGPETEELPSAAAPDAEAQPVLPSSPPLPPPPPPPVRRRTPWGAMLLSGIIGGAVVAGAAAYGYLYYLPNDSSAISVLFARLGAVELTLRDLQAAQEAAPASTPSVGAGTTPAAAGVTQETVTKLADRLAKVEAAISAAAAKAEAPAAPDASKPAGLVSPPAEQLAAMNALSEDVAGLNKRMAETAKALQQARESAAAAMKAAEAKPSEPPGVGKVEFEGLGERVAGLQRNMASLQQDVQRQAAKTTQEDRGVRLAVVAAGLRGAVERGAPFASELEAAKALKADPQAVALLTPFAATGVPSAGALGRQIAALAPSLVKRSAAEADQSYWQRLQSEAEKLVRVRPINSAPGNDPAAAAARIEALGKKGDIAGALAELQKLPEAVRAPAEPWIKKAQAREAAVAAARRIEAAAIAALANHP